jgi:phosphatidylinositol alpha-mannosyltransferase
VLASDLAAFSRVLDGGRTGELFRNEEPAHLAHALLTLLRDPERRAVLAEAGRQRARHFDWSVVAANIMAVYETVIEGRSAALTQPASRWSRFLRGGMGR